MLEKLLVYIQAFFSIISSCPATFDTCDECSKTSFEITEIAQLPDEIKESSGAVVFNQLLFTNSDSGNEPSLYGVGSPFIEEPAVKGFIQFSDSIVNNDWEDLTIDTASFIYIGDFGNNTNERSDLSIVKFDPLRNSSERIFFTYEDQTEFPPKKRKERNFDCEAFFWANDTLFLFSKNKGAEKVKVYALPDSPGSHVAKVVGTLSLDYPITSADISPDGKTMALLTYGKIFLYSLQRTGGTIPGFTPFACISFKNSGQAEAITYIDNSNWLITNEGGKVFWMRAHNLLLPPPESPLLPDIQIPAMEGRTNFRF